MGLFPARLAQKKVWLPILLVIAVSFIVWRVWEVRSAGANKRDRGGFDRAVPVATTTAARGELKLFLGALGTVTPANAVVVKSRVDGQLLRVYFTEGQTVKTGDLLAEIDPRPFEVQLTQAEGQLARDNALLKNAQLDLERYEMLWSQDSIAKQQVDAQAALVRQYEGATKVDAGQVADAKLQLTYSKVTAPASGRVGLRQVDPGNIVHASDTTGIVSIAQVQPIYVVFTLPEDNLPRLVQKLNSHQNIAIDAYDRAQKFKLASGALVAIDNQIDTTTGTVKVKAEFKNDDSALFPNQFVNVRLQIDTLRDATLLPVGAVQRGSQGDFVYVLQSPNTDGDSRENKVTVKLQNVSVGESDGQRVAINTGIEPGTVVVTEGLEQLRDGSAVEVVQRDGEKIALADKGSGPEGKGADQKGGEKRKRKKPGAGE